MPLGELKHLVNRTLADDSRRSSSKLVLAIEEAGQDESKVVEMLENCLAGGKSA